MAAGDLENIIPAPTAKLTRNINFSDVNGVLRSVKEVYYSDNNAQSHLVWKRDHSPGGDEYSDVFNGSQKILLKYHATASSITSLKLWSNSDHNHYNEVIKILNASTGDTIYEMHQGVGPSYDTDTLTVNGTSKTVYTFYKDNLNISVSKGTDYYIYFGTAYTSNYWVPLVYSNTTGDYAEFIGEDYHLQNSNNILSMLTSYNNHKIKAEVNGVQV
jgi:hypothetical protein